MNEYIGKTCPYCKTPFQSGDEVVICSACDMPHHKDCWVENQGCTTFGCMGSIKTADSNETSVTANRMVYDDPGAATAGAAVFCSQCGTKNLGTSSFCTACGARLAAPAVQQPQAPVYTQADPNNHDPYAYVNRQNAYQPQNTYQPQNPYPAQGGYQVAGYGGGQTFQPSAEDELQPLVGPKAEYYLPKFREMREQNKKTSWNWAAFLVTPLWMIYRKMYGYGAAVMAAALVISLVGSSLLSTLLFGGYIACGIFGNFIYLKYLEGKKAEMAMMAEPMRTQFIQKNGGVHKQAVILTIVGYAVLVLLLTA